ncbi:hypothetical protein [Brevibacillus borstelensis]|uniref:hypothetical protein n=1 Tax=Brevibacillus borstelensis TaxID=45462 RepID=UPI0030C3803B
MTQTKTAKVVGLFVAAALTISGCSSGGYDDDCYDADNDGYCDGDGGGGSSSSSSHYYHSSSGKVKSSSSSISSGSKGGIGSSGTSSSG